MMLAEVMGPAYLVFGLSVLFYVKAWGKVISKWSKDHYGLMGLMFLHIVLGLIAVNMYNVWELNVWLLVTITGWGLLLKGVFYFLLPGDTFTSMLKSTNNQGMLYFGGLVATVVGAVLCYHVYFL